MATNKEMNKQSAQNLFSFPAVKAAGRIVLRINFIAVFIVFFMPYASAEATQKKHVLVLNSYHQGLSWTDNIVKGIESVLKGEGKDVELYYEYMDTKRYFDDAYFQKLYELYKYKYRKDRFDVVIVGDNDAFDFVKEHHELLFPGTPVVFCGINNYKDSMVKGYDYLTGVVEETDVRSTIEIALRLHPGVKRIVVVRDDTTTGIAMKKEVLEVMPLFRDTVEFSFIEDFDWTELQARVREIPPKSILLLTVVNRDRTGNFFAYEESLAYIYKVAKVPIYSFWDFYLGKGIMGGMLTSGYQQGRSAAELAWRVLEGEDVKNIPVIKKSPNRYMFDYAQLKRFQIRQHDLPRDSIVINVPDSFYTKYKNFIWTSSITIFSLAGVIFMLLVNISLRKRVEQALRKSEEKYRDLYDNAPDMYHSVNKDGIIIDCNETEAKMLGYRKDEIIGRPIADFLTEDSKVFLRNDFPTLKEKKVLHGLEREYVRKDGTVFPASLNVFIEVDESGELSRTKTIGRDITEQKRVEEELKSSGEQLRNLSAHLQSVREEERRHIASEIHDELGLVLTTLKLDLGWLKKRLPQDDSSLLKKNQSMSDVIDKTIQSVQRICSELRPGVLDYLGLSAAIEWQVGELRERTEIEYDVNIDFEDSRLDQDRATAIFRIFQETLTNVVRHSGAARVEVDIRDKKGSLVIEVKDNGKGITEKQLSDPRSFGIIGVRERAHSLGGEVLIRGIPDKGTTVVVNIPLDGKATSDD